MRMSDWSSDVCASYLGVGAGMLVAKTHKDGVVTLTLCRAAKRNALSVALIEALGAMLDATRDDDMAVQVVRGEGNRDRKSTRLNSSHQCANRMQASS